MKGTCLPECALFLQDVINEHRRARKNILKETVSIPCDSLEEVDDPHSGIQYRPQCFENIEIRRLCRPEKTMRFCWKIPVVSMWRWHSLLGIMPVPLNGPGHLKCFRRPWNLLFLSVHRCGLGGSMRTCHAAGPGSIPGRDKFPGWGFFGVFPHL